MGQILNPQTDEKRLEIIRNKLIAAYASENVKEIAEAAEQVRLYVDDGLNDTNLYNADIEDYSGDDPKMLAEEYIQRVFHDRYLDDDEDQDYITTGLKREKRIFHTIRCIGKEFTQEQWSEYNNATNSGKENRIISTFGKYQFNDFDMCLNPEKKEIATKTGPWGYYVILEWCNCGNGIWVNGLRINTGSGGFSSGCQWTDNNNGNKTWLNGYTTEKDCIIAACENAINHLQNNKDEQVKKLINKIAEYKKSLVRPQPIQLELFAF